MGLFDFLKPNTAPKPHKLKWEIPEARMTAPVEEIEKTIAAIEKSKAKFKSGGEFNDIIHVKEYGPGVYAYFIVRTAKKSEKETIVFDGYMLREDDHLGFEVQSRFSISEDLEKIGYQPAFEREVTEWRFVYLGLKINAYKIKGVGNFIEVCLPATKIEKTRKLNEETAKKFFKMLGINEKEIIPTDVITLQLTAMLEQSQKKR
ncbi:MAG: hypothetical protein V1811_00725 [Candidatus Micrarchaeota archaeon]